MRVESAPLWLAVLTQFALGVAVFRSNPKSFANRSFLGVSVVIVAWLLSLHFAFTAERAKTAEFWIRHASAAGLLVVCGFDLLRIAIVCRDRSAVEMAKRFAILAVPSFGIVALCYTRLFLRSAELGTGPAGHESVPHAVYGPLFPVFAAFVIIAVISVIALYLRDIRRTTGIQKVELQFGVAGAIALSALVAFTPFVDRGVAVTFAPFRIVIFSLIIAYGIATRKIMDVGFFFRRVTAYAVLAAYLLALYGLIWWLVGTAFAPVFGTSSRSVAHVVSALAIAFAMVPARGVSQTLADRLFVGIKQVDFRSTMNQAAAILKSVTTVTELLERFARTIGAAVGTERVLILLPDRGTYRQRYPEGGAGNQPLVFGADEPILQHLITNPEPLVLDELHRMRPSEELLRLTKQMESLQIAVAIGIFAREHLAGVMLLGPRVSGRIYGSVEQSALQVLCGQLAVAVDNAQLFTAVQNAKIYNDTLLQNLTTGVIAADADGRITVFNKEAEQITGLPWDNLIDRLIDDLPAELRDVLRDALTSDELQQHREIVLRSNERNVVVRASSSVFHGDHGEMLGALMVLNDITALKRLELQIRRSDRLASLGTLSAGMAHEIKNPLVSIKTFTQLLPERYQDAEFRETFSNLIGHEIDRIDSLVNQLLRFARPAKPLLKPMHVHEVLDKSLMLVGHRLYQKEIKLSRSWNAEVDTIRADADQLEQVFLNFFLNAMDAMAQGGELNVATEIRAAEEWVAAIHGSNGDSHEVLRITVRDDGEGIRNEDIPHVFDPFFTTKDYGTGLGLSVVHGIIQEHGGQIEVESELAKGTAFHILLPLVRFQEEVAAA